MMPSRIVVPAFDPERILRDLVPEHIRRNLELGRLFPEIVATKQLFDAFEAQPPRAALTPITGGTAEVNLWTPNQWTPFPVGAGANNYLTEGQQWILQASGICTYAATPGTSAFTARVGTSATPATNTILGAASAAVQGTTAAAGTLWWLDGICTVRTVGLPGANSVLYFVGKFHCPLAHQAAGSAGGVLFGGVSAGVDISIANALAISVTPSVTTQSFTPQQISWISRG